MSTFLELCQDLHREVGGAGSAPSAVTGQVGQSLRTVNWIKNAWIKIQNKHANWRWMRKEYFVSLTPPSYGVLAVATSDPTFEVGPDGTAGATLVRFGRWVTDGDWPAGNVKFGTGSTTDFDLSPLVWLDYEHFRNLYRLSEIAQGTPAHYTVDPANNLLVAPAPSASGHYLIGDYMRSPQVLAANGAEPEMPENFHELIVWEAMRRYARFVAAPEVYAHAKEEAGQMMRALEVDQLPEPKFAPPLA